jgi:hypothetical protein
MIAEQSDEYEVYEPSDSSVTGNILKYIALFMLSWIGAWILLLLTVGYFDSNDHKVTDYLFDHPGADSLVIAISVIIYFVYTIQKKYKFGIVFRIIFDDKSQKLILWTKNTFNNKITVRNYFYNDLDIMIEDSIQKFPYNIKTNLQPDIDYVFGGKGILVFNYKGRRIGKINIALSAWCRHESINAIILRLISINTVRN